MTFLAALPGILQGASGLASMFGGLFGKQPLSQRKQAALDWNYQKKASEYNALKLPSLQVNGWQRAGLNPAIMARGALGVNGISAPTVGPASQSTSPFDAVAQGLAGLGDGLGHVQHSASQARNQDLQNQLTQAKIESLNKGFKQPGYTQPRSTMTGGGMVQAPPVDNPRPGYNNPKAPIQEMLDGDNLSSGLDTANPELAPEFETDIYAKAREGRGIQFLYNLAGRQVNTLTQDVFNMRQDMQTQFNSWMREQFAPVGPNTNPKQKRSRSRGPAYDR